MDPGFRRESDGGKRGAPRDRLRYHGGRSIATISGILPQHADPPAANTKTSLPGEKPGKRWREWRHLLDRRRYHGG
jgi:hypothetical protein